MNSHTIESAVRGHHIYKEFWTPQVGQTLTTVKEEQNLHDRYAIAVIYDDRTVGHMPKELSRISWYFIEHGGEIICEIIGRRRLSVIQGKGLEVPCTYTYKGNDKLVKKLTEVLK